MIFFLLII